MKGLYPCLLCIMLICSSCGYNRDNKNDSSVETDKKISIDSQNPLDITIEGTKSTIHVEDSLKQITAIESANWIDKEHIAIVGHVNPSLQCFLLYNVSTMNVEVEKYGIEFNWIDNDITTLVYILPSEHFTDTGDPDVIKDSTDAILYKAPQGASISNLVILDNSDLEFTLTTKDNNVTKETIKK